MNDQVATPEAPTTAAPAPKVPKAPAKPKAKPAAKKASTGPAKKTAASPVKQDRSAADVPVAQRRLALVKLLRKLGATKATTARQVSELAGKLGYTNYDVYCLAYHTYFLAEAGIVKTCVQEGERGLGVYLTAKGVKATDEQVAG